MNERVSGSEGGDHGDSLGAIVSSKRSVLDVASLHDHRMSNARSARLHDSAVAALQSQIAKSAPVCSLGGSAYLQSSLSSQHSGHITEHENANEGVRVVVVCDGDVLRRKKRKGCQQVRRESN